MLSINQHVWKKNSFYHSNDHAIVHSNVRNQKKNIDHTNFVLKSFYFHRIIIIIKTKFISNLNLKMNIQRIKKNKYKTKKKKRIFENEIAIIWNYEKFIELIENYWWHEFLTFNNAYFRRKRFWFVFVRWHLLWT